VGNNILDLYNGGIPIQSHLRKFHRKLNGDNNAGVTTWVLLMFGMIFIMYLFGYTNMYNTYTDISVGGNSSMNLTNASEDLKFGVGILQMIGNALSENGLFAGLSIFAGIALVFIGYITKTLSTILQFLIPLILMAVLNIFVFPLGSLSTDLQFMNIGGLSISSALFAFFNICYILAVIEFVRGNA
jgi:hypothetical protein